MKQHEKAKCYIPSLMGLQAESHKVESYCINTVRVVTTLYLPRNL
jgi:hypothetical protein